MIMITRLLATCALCALVNFSASGQVITIDCATGMPVAQIQAPNKLRVTCEAIASPVPKPTPVPTPVPKPTPVPVPTPSPTGKVWQATPNNLQELIGSGSPVKPGDVIVLTSGAYLPPSWGPYSAFRAQVSGDVDSPITIKGNAGAFIDGKNSAYGALYLEGNHLVLSGVEITNTDPDRTKPRGNGIEVRGDFLTIDGCYIHAVSTGVFASETAKWLRIVNNLVIDNGYKTDSDQPHGNGLYVQNGDGENPKFIEYNVVAYSYGNGVQLFGRNAGTKGYVVRGNIVFRSGMSLDGRVNWPNRNFIVGGSKQGADGLVVSGNFFYEDLDFKGANVFFGYEKGNGSANISNNCIVGGTGAYIIDWSGLNFENNVIVAQGRGLTYDSPNWAGTWRGNKYYFPDKGFASQGGLPVQTWTWEQWRASTGEQGSSFSEKPVGEQWMRSEYGMAVYSPSGVFNLAPWLPTGKQAFDAVTGQRVITCTVFCAVMFK